MNAVVIVLMCYFHQPAAIFHQLENGAWNLYPFVMAPLTAEEKVAAKVACMRDPKEGEDEGNFKIWHLDKINNQAVI